MERDFLAGQQAIDRTGRMVSVMDHSVPTNVSSVTGSISTSLLDRVKARDAEAWRRLTDIFGPAVYHWARHAGLQEADAENIIQDVFVAVATKIDGFQPTAAGRQFPRLAVHDRPQQDSRSFPPSRRSGGSRRWNHRAPAPPVACPSQPKPRPSSSTLQSAEQLAVRRAVESIRGDFQDHTWQAFWLTTVEDKPPKDVAEQLGMTLAAVQQAKYRVKQRLRKNWVSAELRYSGWRR